MPTFQLSILSSYDPAAHFAMGRALAPLRDEGVLIVGSWLSYHNLRLRGPESATPSAEFDTWLTDALLRHGQERVDLLSQWESAPSARVCHPAEDHLVPLFVALGAAEDEAAKKTYFDQSVMGHATASSWRFG